MFGWFQPRPFVVAAVEAVAAPEDADVAVLAVEVVAAAAYVAAGDVSGTVIVAAAVEAVAADSRLEVWRLPYPTRI